MSPVEMISVVVIGVALAWTAVIVAFPARTEGQQNEAADPAAERRSH